MKTFNKRGDQGETSLLYGQRTSKASLRCEFYGTVDEAVSAIGLARSLSKKKKVRDILFDVQKELFVPAAELAVPREHYAEYSFRGQIVQKEMVERLARLIEEFEKEIKMPDQFVIPGGSTASAAIDVARTIVRRAERRAVQLKEEGLLPNQKILSYLNRVADLLFVLARYEEAK
ncbi:MAG: cob(I)yrinic acid a,c-diamide adenosyltransferase [Bacillota bacterium]